MTKVYLVKAHGGDWEDKWEMITHAFFDLEKAEEIKAKSDLERDNQQKELDSLYEHVTKCQHYYIGRDKDDVCEVCEKFYDLQNSIEEGCYHTIEEIKVK